MKPLTDDDTFYPANRKEWRNWLKKNHKKRNFIWLICYKTSAGIPTITWSEAVDEALCFGWIDSTRKSIDDKKFIQYFSKRKPGSYWSQINKDKVKRLIQDKLMTKAGLEIIEVAKKNGNWSLLEDVEKLIIPDDLKKGFLRKPKAEKYFQSLSNSMKKSILQWIVVAKIAETREKRIQETLDLASQHLIPKQFR